MQCEKCISDHRTSFGAPPPEPETSVQSVSDYPAQDSGEPVSSNNLLWSTGSEAPDSSPDETQQMSQSTPAIEPVSQLVSLPTVRPAIHDEDIPAVGRHSFSDDSFDTGKAVRAHSFSDTDAKSLNTGSGAGKKVQFDSHDVGAQTEPLSTETEPGARSAFDAGVPMSKQPEAIKRKENIIHRIFRVLGIKHGNDIK